MESLQHTSHYIIFCYHFPLSGAQGLYVQRQQQQPQQAQQQGYPNRWQQQQGQGMQQQQFQQAQQGELDRQQQLYHQQQLLRQRQQAQQGVSNWFYLVYAKLCKLRCNNNCGIYFHGSLVVAVIIIK